ncbi:MAG: nitrilase-related carbon-nitrogen hydrolase [Alphaproteobacteria bacterium]|nr:nitrilase-related carbon-nitrogen hydrolase [Alphaproteobacteria bacterium]
MTVFTAAVVQAAPVAFDVQRTLDKLADLAADAARKGAKLAVFPEAFVSAYPKGLDFGARVGMRTPEGRDMFRRYFDSAIDVPGPATARIAEIAKANDLHLVVGVIERDGGTLYCTALFFTPAGGLAAKHRKVMPTAMERLIWGTGDGSTLSVIDSPFGKIGAVICWENYMPLLRTAMYAKGIELYCAPTVDCRRTWAPTMRHIAVEGRCFVLSACQYARRSDFPADYPIDAQNGDEILIDGGSLIVSPMGDILAGPNYEGECILTAEVDRRLIAGGKFDLDVVGHYARPDIFQLHVDERKKSAVVYGAKL